MRLCDLIVLCGRSCREPVMRRLSGSADLFCGFSRFLKVYPVAWGVLRDVLKGVTGVPLPGCWLAQSCFSRAVHRHRTCRWCNTRQSCCGLSAIRRCGRSYHAPEELSQPKNLRGTLFAPTGAACPQREPYGGRYRVSDAALALGYHL